MTKDNIQELLQLLEFEHEGDIYTKRYVNVSEPTDVIGQVDVEKLAKTIPNNQTTAFLDRFTYSDNTIDRRSKKNFNGQFTFHSWAFQ